MLEYYTHQKLLEYDRADRCNRLKIRREQEKYMVYDARQKKIVNEKWYAVPFRLFRKTHRRQKYRT